MNDIGALGWQLVDIQVVQGLETVEHRARLDFLHPGERKSEVDHDQSGGAGKSSLVGTLAPLLTETGHRVLALDSDPNAGPGLRCLDRGWGPPPGGDEPHRCAD